MAGDNELPLPSTLPPPRVLLDMILTHRGTHEDGAGGWYSKIHQGSKMNEWRGEMRLRQGPELLRSGGPNQQFASALQVAYGFTSVPLPPGGGLTVAGTILRTSRGPVSNNVYLSKLICIVFVLIVH